MRVSSRYWAGVALTGVLTAFALVLQRPVPLIGAAGLGTWLLAHQYRFVRQTRRTVDGLTVEQTSSRERVTKDEPFTVRVAASLDHPSSLDVAVTSRPSVSVTDVGRDERRCRLEPGDQEATTTLTAAGTVAGHITFDYPEATLTDPFGFFGETVTVGHPLDVQVETRAPRDLHVGAGGERLAIGYGEHDTMQLGAGLEPAEIREYAPGDEMRRIDWKATARLNYPHVRKYERKTPRRTTLVVDHRAKMGTGPRGEQMLDYARDVALLFLNNASTHEDPVSLYAVGDEGLTVEEEFGAGLDQYNRLRQRLDDLTPTSDADVGDRANDELVTHPARARRRAERLSSGTTAFDRTLRPYVAERDAYVRRLETRPLFAAVRSHAADLRQSTWTILLTDDSGRAEVHDAVKLARRGDGHVAVFLTPSVLFEDDARSDPKVAYRRYRDFEQFRRKLSEMDDVTAFEVAPGGRLEAVLSAGRRRRRATGSVQQGRSGGVQ
jgi:uncharacterized protein (DUF58 family)